MCRVEMLFEMLLHALGFGKEGACGFRVVARDIMRLLLLLSLLLLFYMYAATCSVLCCEEVAFCMYHLFLFLKKKTIPQHVCQAKKTF